MFCLLLFRGQRLRGVQLLANASINHSIQCSLYILYCAGHPLLEPVSKFALNPFIIFLTDLRFFNLSTPLGKRELAYTRNRLLLGLIHYLQQFCYDFAIFRGRGTSFNLVTRLLADKSGSIPCTVQTESVVHPAHCQISTMVPFHRINIIWREECYHPQLMPRLRMHRLCINSHIHLHGVVFN